MTRAPTLLLLICGPLLAQAPRVATAPLPKARPLRLPVLLASPQEILRAMVARDRAWRKQPGATVEVVGQDEAAALKGLSMQASQRLRQEFHVMDLLGEQELYAFMHQDPAHPASVLLIPRRAGEPSSTPDAKWLR